MHLNHTMLPLRLARRSICQPVSINLLRTFSATATYFRSPSLADVTSEGLASFDQKQKEFRQRLADLQKKKDARQFRAATYSSSTPTAPAASNASSLSKLRASNLSSTSFIGATASTSTNDDEFENGGRRKGTLSSLIYGTKEGREMDKEIEQSFSQVLARGKYVHSIVFHHVKPEKVDEYVDLVGGWYPKMAALPENKVHLVGSWRTEVGDCDTFGKCSIFYNHIRMMGPTHVPANTSKSIFGSISATMATTTHYTRLPPTPTSLPSIQSSKLL
jgi:hypothetical protein